MTATGPDGTGTRDAPHFGGRAREREILRRLLEEHRATARGALVLIGAGPGMGKSTLVDRFVREAPAATLLRVHCTGETVPFGPLLELERRLNPRGSEGGIEGGSEGDGEAGGDAEAEGPRPSFANALVALQLAAARQPAGTVTQPRTVRARATALHDGFATLLGEVATPIDQPARVLLIEDLHAADADTLHVLRRLTAPPFPLRSLILANYRDAGQHATAGPALQRLIHRIDALSGSDSRFVHLRLSPLDATEVREVLEQRFPGIEANADGVAELARRCAGNPERLDGALNRLRDRGVLKEGRRGWSLGELPAEASVYEEPPRRQLLAGLRPGLRATLRRAAVLGVRFSTSLLARLEGRDDLAVLEDFQAAHDEGHDLLEPLRDSFVFRDPDVPALLRGELLRPLRKAYAARAAEILRRAQKRDEETGLSRIHPSRVAALAELAGDRAVALRAHLAAARHDELLLALNAAISHLQRARHLMASGVKPEGEDARHVAWRAAADLGRLLVTRPAETEGPGASDAAAERSDGLQILTEAVALADAADADVLERAALRTSLGLTLAESTHSRAEGLNQVRRARTLLVVGGLPAVSWRLARHEVAVLLAMDDAAGAIKVGQQALKYFRTDAADDPSAKVEIGWTLVRLAALRRRQLAPPGAPDREPQRKAIEAALEEARQSFRGVDDHGAAMTLHERARLLQEHARERTTPADREGPMVQAQRLLEEALTLCEQAGDPPGVAEVRQTLGQVSSALGRPEEAAQHLALAGRLRLAHGDRDISDLLALLDEVGGLKALKVRDELARAAGLPASGSATRVIPALTEED